MGRETSDGSLVLRAIVQAQAARVERLWVRPHGAEGAWRPARDGCRQEGPVPEYMQTPRRLHLGTIQKGDPWPSTSRRTCTSTVYRSPPDIQTTRHFPSRMALIGQSSRVALSTGFTLLSSAPCGGLTLISRSCAS